MRATACWAVNDRESRLAILRDSHVGAFAVVGGVSLLLLKWTLVVGIPAGERTALLVLFPCLSRFAMVITMGVFPYIRAQGLGTAFQVGSSWRQLALRLLSRPRLPVGCYLALPGCCCWHARLVSPWVSDCGLDRMLGGMTGDTYGATNEIAEVTVLLLGVILIRTAPTLVDAPFW